MARCPTCKAPIPFTLTLKSTDGLLFPEEGAERCPACRGRLIPTTKSVIVCLCGFLGLAAVCFVSIRFGLISGIASGFVAGLVFSLGGLFVASRLIRFRTDVNAMASYDRRTGLGIFDNPPPQ